MDSFSLYDDLPLFSGDLVGLSPLPDELPNTVQDEFQLKQLPFHSVEPLKGSLIEQPKKEVSITIDFNNVNLLDTKVDLLELLQEAEKEAAHPEPEEYQHLSNTLENFYPVTSQASADDLYNVSEMLASDLQSIEYSAPVGSFIQNEPSGDQLFEACKMSGLASTAGVLGDNDVDEEMDSILNDSNLLSATHILSPVSPEDVESVLSSGPTSPYGTLDSESETSVYIVGSITTPTVNARYLREELAKPALAENFEDETEAVTIGPQRSQRQRNKYEPYSPSPAERSPRLTNQAKSGAQIADSRQRKKQQNKDAALRYRQKKKEEKATVFDECDQLEKKNSDLKEKVDSMTREIQYLKDLLAEVYQAKKSGSKSQSIH